MDLENLDSVVESLLFVSGTALGITEICSTLDVQKSELNACIKRLDAKYSGNSGIVLHKFNNKLQLLSNPSNKEFVESVLLPIKQRELTKATIESLAVIAYKQPITKLEIEQIRGVNCDYALQILTKYDLIQIAGHKDSVGKPLLFATTEAFLKRFGLESVANLPDYDSIINLLEQMQDMKPVEDGTLYNEYEVATQTQMPEFLEGEEGVISVN